MTCAGDDQDVASRLRRLLAQLEGLPEGDVESIGVLIDAGEWTVALENLCTQAYEYDVEPAEPIRREIHELGERLDVHTAYLLGDPWADRDGR
ncbi:MAG TPA: MafI family immunity protein [Acidimicrobiales bacterium]|nr:MafI family immunity protein [Acidimicrobiales bacterium]